MSLKFKLEYLHYIMLKIISIDTSNCSVFIIFIRATLVVELARLDPYSLPDK